MGELVRVVLSATQATKNHRDLCLHDSSTLNPVVFSLVPDSHIEAGQRKQNHEVDKTQKVAYKQDHEHQRIEEGRAVIVVAVVLVRVEDIVAPVQPGRHRAIAIIKAAQS